MLGDTRGAPCREHSFLPARTPFQTGLPIHRERWLRQRRGWAGASTRGGLLGAPGAAPRGRPLPEEGCGPGRGSGSFPCCGHDGRADPPTSPWVPQGGGRRGEAGPEGSGEEGRMSGAPDPSWGPSPAPCGSPWGQTAPADGDRGPSSLPPGARRSKGGAAQPDVGSFILPSLPLFRAQGP